MLIRIRMRMEESSHASIRILPCKTSVFKSYVFCLNALQTGSGRKAKPNNIFESLEELLDVKPGEVVHGGDGRKNYVCGARDTG